MKITKKFLSILLATILILSVFPVTLAQASDSAITFSAETDAKNVKVGDTISVSVNMSEYRKLGALTLVVNYDSTSLKILDVQSKNAFGYEEFNTDYGSGKLAYLIASLDTKTVSGTLFTIQFEVLKEGCTEVSLTVNELTDIDFKTLSSSTQSAKIHNYDNGTVTPPTCVDKGYTTYACECGYSYQTDETDAKGHNFVNGTCTECSEKSVKWKFDEATGTLTIYGTGPMEDYASNNRPWESHKDDIQNVVIGNGVTTIGKYAFYDCKSLTSVTIPDSITSIGYSAFKYCTSLTSLTIPDSVTIIGDYAFDTCKGLTNITLGDGITTIGRMTFFACSGLLCITIPDSVTSIGYCAFDSCKGLTSVTFGDSLAVIDSRAFQHCTNLKTITIPDSVTSIGISAFYDCYRLTSVTIGDGVTSIDKWAFSDCYSLTDVYYLGAEKEWNNIAIDKSDNLNDPLLNARIHYNSTGADTHPFNPVVTPPTCTEQGYTTYVCACGYSNGVVDNYVDATGHKYESEITKPATHLAEGIMTYTCHCGDSYTEAIEKISEHNHEAVVTPPTCTEQGFTTYTCECGDTYVADYVNANGHSYNPVVTPPTCTEGGYTTYTCTVCSDTYVADETSATGHSYESEITKPATHTENGVMTYTCHCGDTYTETINATGDHFHTPTVTPPTCTEGGFTTYTCVCGDTYIDDYVDALGHKYESEITKTATHLAEGLMTYTCHCGDSYTEVIEKIAEHNHEAVVTPPTCTEQGFTTYTCVCGDTYVADYVNANGHSYNSVVTVPTCTKQGFTTYTCAVCNDTYVDDEIPATGHSYQNGICTVCDYADPDYFVFSVKEPSITKIRNKDGIILHAEIEGNRPEGSYVEWTVDNGNFDKTAMNNGDELRVIANNKGYTTFTATLYDADGNELAKDTVELYSQSGFFDKIGGFFRSLFGTTKIYEN